MRILANILRTFKVSSRESCRISNRRYSKQICPILRGWHPSDGGSATLVCVRSIQTTPLNYKGNETSGTFGATPSNGRNSDQIVPVALLKANDQPDAASLKIVVIPMNFFSNDDEAVQKTLTTMSVLRQYTEQLKAFTDYTNSAEAETFSNSNVNLPSITGRSLNEPLWEEFESEKQSSLRFDNCRDGLEEIVAEHEINRIKPKNSFDSLDWSQNRRKILSEMPENLEKSLAHAGITSMNLAFEMDMTNIKDAILMHQHNADTPFDEMEQPSLKSLKDPTLTLTTCIEDESVGNENTVPLNFNALIQGTVNIDSSKITPKELEDMEVPQYNDYVTAIAANICSTALQKGFPADLSRMYSTKSPSDSSNKPQNPHVVCVREGDKGCVSSGNADMDPYIPKNKSSESGNDSSTKVNSASGSNTKPECEVKETMILTSTIIGDVGARGLMSCQAYAKALKEASRLRELAAAAAAAAKEAAKDNCGKEKKEEKKEDKCGGGSKNKCEPLPCGPPKQDSICKGKNLTEPKSEKQQQSNDPCKPQDAPCKAADTTTNTKMAADDKDSPCKKVPGSGCVDSTKKKKQEEEKESDNPCAINYPKQCPPKTKTGDCKRRIVDPCASNECVEKKQKKEEKPKPKTCDDDPCKPKKDCAEVHKVMEDSKQKPNLVGAETEKEPVKCGADTKSEAPKCTGQQANPCAEKEQKAEAPKCAEKKAEAPKCAEKKAEAPKCAEKKSEAPKCAEKKSEAPKCAEKKSEAPKCAEKKSEAPKCAEKKSEAPKCAEKKSEAPKCAEKAEAPKCPPVKEAPPQKSDTQCGAPKEEISCKPKACESAEKKNVCTAPVVKFAEPDKKASKCAAAQPKCGSEPSKCAEKKAEAPKCAEKKAEAPKCAEKKAEAPKCAEKAETPKCGSEKDKCGTEKKAQDAVTKCPNTESASPRGTAPNCKEQKRHFSTALFRHLFASAYNGEASFPINQLKKYGGAIPINPMIFYSSEKGGKKKEKIVNCPMAPPVPKNRTTITRKSKDCFSQDRLDDPCYKPPPKDRNKTDCVEHQKPKDCWDDDTERK